MVDLAILLPNYVDGKLGGTQTFVDELVSRLSKSENLQITVYCQKGQEHRFKDVETVPYFVSAKSKLTSLFGILQTANPRFQRKIRKHDVAFFPLQAAMRVRSIKIPTLVTIHDVQHLDLPSLFSRSERLYRKFAYDRQAGKFTHIATDSEFSKVRIEEQLRIRLDKISTILIGTRSIGIDTSLERENFLIYPARGWPHKNHSNLFDAVRLAIRQGHEVKLYLILPPLIQVPL